MCYPNISRLCLVIVACSRLAAAREWYGRAAELGYQRAAFNLGMLEIEQGAAMMVAARDGTGGNGVALSPSDLVQRQAEGAEVRPMLLRIDSSLLLLAGAAATTLETIVLRMQPPHLRSHSSRGIR